MQRQRGKKEGAKSWSEQERAGGEEGGREGGIFLNCYWSQRSHFWLKEFQMWASPWERKRERWREINREGGGFIRLWPFTYMIISRHSNSETKRFESVKWIFAFVWTDWGTSTAEGVGAGCEVSGGKVVEGYVACTDQSWAYKKLGWSE